MSSSLRVSEKGSINAPLGVLSPGEGGRLGRGEVHQFTITSEAVSYDHGEFRFSGGLWFFRDLESTNGSWFEGQKLPHNVWVPLTTGTALKVANVELDIEVIGSGLPIGQDTLVVIGPNADLQEFTIPQTGKALVLGGAEGNFHLDANGSDPVSLIVERSQSGVSASNPTGILPLYKNGQTVTFKEQLTHLDQLEVGKYRVFICLPNEELNSSSVLSKVRSDKFDSRPFSSVSDSLGFEKAKRGLPFGQTNPEGRFEDADLEKLGVESVFSSRYEISAKSFTPDKLEGKLLIISLLFLLLSMGSLLGWLVTKGS